MLVASIESSGCGRNSGADSSEGKGSELGGAEWLLLACNFEVSDLSYKEREMMFW